MRRTGVESDSFCLVLINIMTYACFLLHTCSRICAAFLLISVAVERRPYVIFFQVRVWPPKLAACHIRRREASADLIGKWIKIESW